MVVFFVVFRAANIARLAVVAVAVLDVMLVIRTVIEPALSLKNVAVLSCQHGVALSTT